MKKTAILAMTLMLGGTMALVSCGNNQADKAPAQQTSANEETVAAGTNIRYVDGDSIMTHYNLAKDVQEFILKTNSRIDNVQQSRGTEIQRFAAQIEQKGRNNGYLSQESYNADMNRLQKMQQDAESAIAGMQRSAAQELDQQQRILNDSIEAFIKDYNAQHGYDAILFKSAGLYFNPALDITQEVIDGLNKRYNKVEAK